MENNNQPEQPATDENTKVDPSMLESIPAYMKQVILNPVQFYSSTMKKSGGFIEPLIFMIAMALITAVIMAVIGLIGFGPVGMMAMGFTGIIVIPVIVTIFGFIGAAIAFIIWKIMGSEQDFETAYRCVAYSYAYAPVAALVAGIPYLGTVISSLWPMALLAIASIHVHQRSEKASWAVFGILGLVFLLMGWGAESTGRQMATEMEGWSREMEQKYGDPENMTPEDAAKAASEFFKRMQKEQESSQAGE